MTTTLAAMRPVASHPPEARFQEWMRERGIDPRELEVYDFRRAMLAGAERGSSGHWSSDYKHDYTNYPEMQASDRRTHPALIVGGFHTKTGARVPGAPLARSVQELIDLGWEPATAQQLWQRR